MSDQILDFIREHQGSTIGDIARGTGPRAYRSTVRAVTKLLEQGEIKRVLLANQQSIYFTADEVEVSGRALDCSKKMGLLEAMATNLEARALWRRAAQVYLELLYIASSNTDLQRFVDRRRFCLRAAAHRGVIVEQGYMAGRYVGGEL